MKSLLISFALFFIASFSINAQISAPTPQQIEAAATAKKERVLQIFEKHVVFHGVTLPIEFGAPRGGKIAVKFHYMDGGELKTRYITKEYYEKFPTM